MFITSRALWFKKKKKKKQLGESSLLRENVMVALCAALMDQASYSSQEHAIKKLKMMIDDMNCS